jgi:hypothetical protein
MGMLGGPRVSVPSAKARDEIPKVKITTNINPTVIFFTTSLL